MGVISSSPSDWGPGVHLNDRSRVSTGPIGHKQYGGSIDEAGVQLVHAGPETLPGEWHS